MSSTQEANQFEGLVNSGNFLTRVKNGYLQFMEDGEWIWVHRRVVELQSGKKIPKGYEVHHINRDKTDNRAENLQILSKAEHRAIHSKDKAKKIDKNKYLEKIKLDAMLNSIIQGKDLLKSKKHSKHFMLAKKIFSKINTISSGCSRCGGTGYLPEFNYYMGGICFKCMGSG